MKKFKYIILLGSFLTLSNSGMAMQGGPPPLNQLMNQGGGGMKTNNNPPPLNLLQQQPNQNSGGLQPPPFNQIMNQNIQGGPPPLNQLMTQGGGNQGRIPQAPSLNLNMPSLNQPMNQGNNNPLQRQATLNQPQVNPQAQQGGINLTQPNPMLMRKNIKDYLQGTLSTEDNAIKNLIKGFSTNEEGTKTMLLQGVKNDKKDEVEGNIIAFLSDGTVRQEVEKLKPKKQKTLIEKIRDNSINLPKAGNINVGFLCLQHLLENPVNYKAANEIILKTGVLQILKGELFGINQNKEATPEEANFIKQIKNDPIPLLNKKLGDLLTDNDFETLKQGTYFIKQGNNLIETPVDQRFITHLDTLKALIRGN